MIELNNKIITYYYNTGDGDKTHIINECIFLDSVFLDSSETLCIKNSIFNKTVATTVLFLASDLMIENCLFLDEVFLESEINGNVIIRNNIFNKGLIWGDSILKKNVTFENNITKSITDTNLINSQIPGKPIALGSVLILNNIFPVSPT